jgi:hypothetical protein
VVNVQDDKRQQDAAEFKIMAHDLNGGVAMIVQCPQVKPMKHAQP